MWLSTLDEKCEAGEIIYDLTIQDNHAADIHKPYLQLARRGGGEEALANFRAGDAVVLYERNSEQDNVTNKNDPPPPACFATECGRVAGR